MRVTVSRANVDYIMMLNHIESGFSRDNQVQIANKDGDLISDTKDEAASSKTSRRHASFSGRMGKEIVRSCSD